MIDSATVSTSNQDWTKFKRDRGEKSEYRTAEYRTPNLEVKSQANAGEKQFAKICEIRGLKKGLR